jgi:Concanavalin A-like lectin/glucanases superfamily
MANGSWIIDNTTSIHGFVPQLIGAPVVENGDQGAALCFDGDDGIVLDANPLEGLAAFTLEVLFMPEAVSAAETALIEPRFVHIESATGDRATVEARVNDGEFYLDTFLKSGTQSLTLIDETKVHPVGAWYWSALSYADGQMRHFVEGVEDASGAVTVAPLGPGKISIGVRQNLQYWFKGCVRELRVTPEALPPELLQRVQ